MLRAVGARQRSRKSIDRIVFADQDQFAGPMSFGSKSIADLKACSKEGVLWDRDLVLGAHSCVSTAASRLYFCSHE